MSITFSPLWNIIKKKKLPKGYLREKVGLSPATVARIFKDEPVTLEVIDRICSVMEVQIQDIIQYEEKPFSKAKSRNKS